MKRTSRSRTGKPFAELKALSHSNRSKTVRSTGSSSTRDTEEEHNLFAAAMKGVSPLQQKNARIIHEKPKPRPKKITQPDWSDNKAYDKTYDGFSDHEHPHLLQMGDTLSYRAAGLQKRAFRKLRGGGYPIADRLDLHGLTRKEARALLYEFLTIIDVPPHHCLLIVHGKGYSSHQQQSILKTSTYYWLKQHDRVLAFHSALTTDGGTGAVYVLLKN
ncbi:MAG: Smr/MutS family protein [bacterium]